MNNPQLVFKKARAAAARLRATTVQERVGFITRLKEVILRDREEIMTRIQKDTGKCRSDALMSEIFPVLDCLHYLEKQSAKVLRPRKAPTPIALLGKKSEVQLEPMGTVLVISPWNYPFYQAIVPCTMAFAAGNSVVYKPSEHTPLTGLVESVLKAAGFADDWIQVSYGDGAHASQLIECRPEKIFFTGSVATGKKIMSKAAEQLIPVELELGGKDPMIVFEDANLDRAAAGAVWGALTNCGQSCTSIETVYVHESVYDRFKTKLLENVARIKQDIDADGDSDVGYMTVDFQSKLIAEQLADAEQKGARIIAGEHWDRKSRAIPPLVVENITAEMKLISDETFGPVIPLTKFATEDEVIEKANASKYGLSASVWSKDIKRAKRVASRLVTGNVSINNVMLTEANPALPFGGVKESGFGRYKGEFGLLAFSNIKSVLIDADSRKIEANWYPYTKEKYSLFSRMMVALFSGGVLNFIRFVFAGLKLESYSNKATRAVTSRPKTASLEHQAQKAL